MPRQTPGERLHANNKKAMEVKRERVWSVTTDTLVSELFCSCASYQDIAVCVAFLAEEGVSVRISETDTEGVACARISPPIEHAALPESYMQAFIGCLRDNQIHGRYHAKGTGEYRF